MQSGSSDRTKETSVGARLQPHPKLFSASTTTSRKEYPRLCSLRGCRAPPTPDWGITVEDARLEESTSAASSPGPQPPGPASTSNQYHAGLQPPQTGTRPARTVSAHSRRSDERKQQPNRRPSLTPRRQRQESTALNGHPKPKLVQMRGEPPATSAQTRRTRRKCRCPGAG